MNLRRYERILQCVQPPSTNEQQTGKHVEQPSRYHQGYGDLPNCKCERGKDIRRKREHILIILLTGPSTRFWCFFWCATCFRVRHQCTKQSFPWQACRNPQGSAYHLGHVPYIDINKLGGRDAPLCQRMVCLVLGKQTRRRSVDHVQELHISRGAKQLHQWATSQD